MPDLRHYCNACGTRISLDVPPEATAESQLHRALDNLGWSPMARSKLGLNIARTGAAFDLARQSAQDDG
jgi:hypothetical protein